MAVDTLWACDTGLACVREERTRDKRDQRPETRPDRARRRETRRDGTGRGGRAAGRVLRR